MTDKKTKSASGGTTKLDSKLQKIIDEIAKLSVLQLSELVKAIEEKFDVQAITATPTASTAPVAGSETPAVEEKSEFEVVITNAGTNKIAVIKTVREFKQELGLKEAKDLIDAPPASLGTMKKDTANDAKTKLETAGAQVELK
ncbi:50S ribosomal protein L7/L12 [Patescibacteria group bacterium]|nr:50S ribosomal protein L7/L12 [Patescibacteria group bacterium]